MHELELYKLKTNKNKTKIKSSNSLCKGALVIS